jgi:hypothetical protein
MPKIFYTERDIEDLYYSGVATLVVNDEVVVTDLGREKARKLGVELVKEHDQPSSAPVRPYITKNISPSAASPLPETPTAPPTRIDLEKRIYEAVQNKLGQGVESDLLKTIISRVLKNVGGS